MQDPAERLALMDEDKALHQAWQERSARRQQQIQVLTNPPTVAPQNPENPILPRPRRHRLFGGLFQST
jgi:hypothetical protein